MPTNDRPCYSCSARSFQWNKFWLFPLLLIPSNMFSIFPDCLWWAVLSAVQNNALKSTGVNWGGFRNLVCKWGLPMLSSVNHTIIRYTSLSAVKRFSGARYIEGYELRNMCEVTVVFYQSTLCYIFYVCFYALYYHSIELYSVILILLWQFIKHYLCFTCNDGK